MGTGGRTFESTDARESLQQALGNLQAEIAESRAEVTVDELPTVTADRIQLVQLFQNLVGNAVKYRREEPLCVHIDAEEKESNWEFRVRDNGIGIPPEFLEKRIFQIFHRLHTDKEYAGTGIGLAICRKTVERHDGRIWVESKPGKGSTFYFTLPTA